MTQTFVRYSPSVEQNEPDFERSLQTLLDHRVHERVDPADRPAHRERGEGRRRSPAWGEAPKQRSRRRSTGSREGMP